MVNLRNDVNNYIIVFKRSLTYIKMPTSILEKEYIEQDRPYSQTELNYKREQLYRVLRLGSISANHQKCNHFYFVKENGRKETEIKESHNSDVGNCSVCWKFNKTPRQLKTKVRNLIQSYGERFVSPPTYLSYEDVDLETVYYTWLFEEVNN